MFSLPGHNLTVPWYIGGTTADILSEEQKTIFRDYLLSFEHSTRAAPQWHHGPRHSENHVIKLDSAAPKV